MRLGKLLKGKWVEIPNTVKIGIIMMPIIISVASFYIDDYFKLIEELSAAEILLVNFGLLMLVLGFGSLFVFSAASSTNASRARMFMGYELNYTSDPVLFGRRNFRMVNNFSHSLRFLTIQGTTSLSAIRTKNFFEDLEKEISCEKCDREYGDGEGELYIVLEGHTYHILGFTLGKRKIDDVLGFCGRHFDNYAKDNKVKVSDKRNLEKGQKVFIKYDGETKNGVIKEVMHPDGFPSLADEEKHPSEPSELSFDLGDNFIYDRSDRVWEKESGSYKNIGENASIYYGQV